MPTTIRLAAIRAAAGISQSALARELNVATATVWRWEHGHRGIDDQTKLWLSERFDVSVPYLMGWPEREVAA